MKDLAKLVRQKLDEAILIPGEAVRASFSHWKPLFRFYIDLTMLDWMEPEMSKHPRIVYKGKCFRVDFCQDREPIEQELRKLDGEITYKGGFG